jgi:hypothetical protein
VPEGFLNPNVEGHRSVGPLKGFGKKGFGKMWQKTYHRSTWKHLL